MTSSLRQRIAAFALISLLGQGLSSVALGQDDDFGDFPPPPDDFGGDSFNPPPVAPLTPDDGTMPPPSFFEPPPPMAPPKSPPAAGSTLGDPNPGEAFSSTEEPPTEAAESKAEDGDKKTETAESTEKKDEEFPLTPPKSYEPPKRSRRASGRAKVNIQELLLPPYQREKPQWAVGLLSSLKPQGDSGSASGSASASILAFALQAEFQPRAIQKYGVLGIGPTFSLFSASDITANAAGLWGVGGQIRYQARYWREQPLVPVAAYSMGMAKYKFKNGENGSVTVSGPLFGLWFLLNVADPGSAASFYADYGISRSYLVGELHMAEGSDDNLAFSGISYYFGMRVEF